MWQDIAVAWRFLLKRPIATAIAVLTLGVTVATSTVTIGVLDQALWRPARGEHGSELVTIYSRRLAPPFYQTLSYPDYVQVRERLDDALELAALVRVENTIGGGEWPTRLTGELVSGNYFSVLNAKPFLGRLLTPDDDRAGGAPVVVLGHDVWRRTFGADPALVGSSLRLGRSTVTVVGVTAPGFHSPAWPSNYWLPLSMASTVFGAELLSRADAAIFQTIGRARISGSRSAGEEPYHRDCSLLERRRLAPRRLSWFLPEVLASLSLDGRSIPCCLCGAGGVRSRHRVRQPCGTSGRSRRRTATRACGASGAWRQPFPARPPSGCGGHGVDGLRRRGGLVARGLERTVCRNDFAAGAGEGGSDVRCPARHRAARLVARSVGALHCAVSMEGAALRSPRRAVSLSRHDRAELARAQHARRRAGGSWLRHVDSRCAPRAKRMERRARRCRIRSVERRSRPRGALRSGIHG